MLKIRVIPTLLWKTFGLVKGVGFNSWRRIGPVLPAVKVYNRREIDELVLVDIAATIEGAEPDAESVCDFADSCFVPFTVGGGITNIDQINRLLLAGADKVSLNTAPYLDARVITDAAKRYGTQCIVASIDARRTENGRYRCFSHSGTVDQERSPESWARELANRGAGEILITSIERDGTMTGYDLELVERIVNSVGIPVIASGGAGNYQHMVRAVVDAGASAVAAASMFHFTEQTPLKAKHALAAAGIPTRNEYPAKS